MQYKGNARVEELSSLLAGESPRCAVIVSAAFFDETLAALLGDVTERPFAVRIKDALAWGLLTQDEHDDLQVLRQLRNGFAHDLRVKDFDAGASGQIAAFRLWQTASRALPLDRVITSTFHQLLYVVGVIGFRLQHRTRPASKLGALPEPPITDIKAWPPVTDL
ncbi:MAG: hypothetical protein HY000_42030 [Planctomycetes bacterium]|nr:hypothetical protein [Planctomycetota bacterium]